MAGPSSGPCVRRGQCLRQLTGRCDCHVLRLSLLSKALAGKHRLSIIWALRRGLQLVEGHRALWRVAELLSDKTNTGVNDSTTALTIAQTSVMTRGWWELLTDLVKCERTGECEWRVCVYV